MHASFSSLSPSSECLSRVFKNLQEVGISFQFLDWHIDSEKRTNKRKKKKENEVQMEFCDEFAVRWKLAELLQQFVLPQFERHAHGHLGDEPLAGRLGHLLAEAQVDLADAAAAFEEVQGMVRHPVANYAVGRERESEREISRDGGAESRSVVRSNVKENQFFLLLRRRVRAAISLSNSDTPEHSLSCFLCCSSSLTTLNRRAL